MFSKLNNIFNSEFIKKNFNLKEFKKNTIEQDMSILKSPKRIGAKR